MLGQEAGNKLIGYWRSHDIKEAYEFAILTNLIHQEWTGISFKDHKNLKELKTNFYCFS